MQDPAAVLPLEITSAIFELYFYKDGDDDYELHHHGRVLYCACPLLLGAVCKPWRQVAWDTPSLWTKLFFLLNPGGDEPLSPTRLALLEEYIQRSHTLPLDIEICHDQGTEFSATPSQETDFIRILNDSSSRWRKLNLSLPPRLLRQLSPKLTSHPILRSLQLTPTESDRIPTVRHEPTDLEAITANLVYLDISHLFRLRLSVAKLRWIVRMTVSWVECAEILSGAPSLEGVSFRIYGQGPPVQVLPVHHNLRKLSMDASLVGHGRPGRPPPLNGLTSPALTELSVFSLDPVFVQDLIQRSDCRLTDLSLSGGSCDLPQLRNLLRATPALRRLTLGMQFQPTSSVSVFGIIFGPAVVNTGPNTPLLPHLEALEYEMYCQREDDWGAMLRTICPLPQASSPSSTTSSTHLSSTNDHSSPELRLRKLNIFCTRFPQSISTWELESLLLDDDSLDLVEYLQTEGVGVDIVASTDDGVVQLIPLSIERQQMRLQHDSLLAVSSEIEEA